MINASFGGTIMMQNSGTAWKMLEQLRMISGYNKFRNTLRPFMNNNQRELNSPLLINTTRVEDGDFNNKLDKILNFLVETQQAEETNSQSLLRMGSHLVKLGEWEESDKVTTPPIDEDSDVDVIFDEKEELEKKMKETQGEMQKSEKKLEVGEVALTLFLQR
ncbi:hypothetical protein L2E82_35644 [Cichorium intybus]|uniref:Uncharacterized protein n=1 Tax=Cichorium intybus TaxID=13427 RepID=A0ACB9BPE5_CICIN|nr:hypothetical protein L2E82_35644 [Cichorium intybus]